MIKYDDEKDEYSIEIPVELEEVGLAMLDEAVKLRRALERIAAVLEKAYRP